MIRRPDLNQDRYDTVWTEHVIPNADAYAMAD